jgi:hypothetical protein
MRPFSSSTRAFAATSPAEVVVANVERTGDPWAALMYMEADGEVG